MVNYYKGNVIVIIILIHWYIYLLCEINIYFNNNNTYLYDLAFNYVDLNIVITYKLFIFRFF